MGAVPVFRRGVDIADFSGRKAAAVLGLIKVLLAQADTACQQPQLLRKLRPEDLQNKACLGCRELPGPLTQKVSKGRAK